ncbi:AraC family transcriptional regulator [Deefgea piscis]|uniref:AraC family transcriptional regulator n=1 Tax=Deefgea piscis TaxID=2739061 RepID=UPI001C7F8F82|nr:AraC family transcriptional regulator [Deefgea piscis]QZA79915.1 AraC family transcriptional regulator [Deefgea piscis]
MDDYVKRIHLALQYIHRHFDQHIVLADLAQAAHFSPYHFHRIFTAIQHETPNDYLRRIRIERAANLLLIYPPFPMQQIALDCGFKSQALFSRAFRSHFGMTASDWRKGEQWTLDGLSYNWRQQSHRNNENILQDSKNCKVSHSDKPIESIPNTPLHVALEAARNGELPRQISALKFEKMPSCRWVYFWQHGVVLEQMFTLWQRVASWGQTQVLSNTNSRLVSRMIDNPNVTDHQRCAYAVGLLVDADFKAERNMLVAELAAGQYLVVDFCGTVADSMIMAQYVFGYYLPQSKWTFDESRPGHTLGPIKDTQETLLATTKFTYQLCVPVKQRRAK